MRGSNRRYEKCSELSAQRAYILVLSRPAEYPSELLWVTIKGIIMPESSMWVMLRTWCQ
jgi:hypothetical protein